MESEQLVKCWRCDHQHQATLFCPVCQALQLLPPQVDYFTVLGLPQHPAVDESALTQRYYELNRRLHPDLHHAGAAQEKEASLKNTALLTRAYRTLRDAVQRGQYWLELHGEHLGKENNRVPPKLAALVFDVQEKLAEAREARAEGKGATLNAELAQIRADLAEQMMQLRDELDANFTRWHMDKPQSDLLRALKNILSEIAYLRTLQRDVEKESDTQWNG